MSFNNSVQKELKVSRIGNFADFDYLSIKIASPEKILSWSYGEVKNPETINYRTFKPEKDGLLCARIFGPVKDYECLCGKYKKRKYKGIRCEKCDVEVTESRVRRERMGHINLAYPIPNTLYMKSMPSKIGTVLDVQVKELEKVLYFEKYIVVDPKVSTFNKFQIISYEEYESAIETFGSSGFYAERGGKGIYDALCSISLEDEIEKLNHQLASTRSELKKKHYYRRLKMLKEFVSSNNKPDWMVLTVLPVIPPELRPLVPLDGGRIAISDLNGLYANVLIRNARLKKVIESNAPDIIVRSACVILQRAVDTLFNNTSSSTDNKVLKNSMGQPLHSIAHFLKGKHGRFRQNLLGKRVDYSGRSVIVVGPELKLHECGLPKEMALELFKPFVLSKLRLYGKASTIKVANDMIEMKVPEVWEVLEEIISEHPVLLNRAPTLHRLGIQAFEPKLIESKAIRLHPLVCRAFNADFDGDQMAVHIPLSIESQMEARVLMISSNNILSSTNGDPVIVPRKDITAGLYYMTLEMEDAQNKNHTFYSYDDVINALQNNYITINTPIKYVYKYNEDSNLGNKAFTIQTTAGRVMLFNLLPQDGNIKFEDINVAWGIDFLNKIVNKVYRAYGKKVTVIFCDQIMYKGFEYATKSGISIGKDDIIIPTSKKEHIGSAMEKVRDIDNQYKAGYITSRERFNKVTDIWSECSSAISKDMMVNIKKDNNTSKINSIAIMMNSGARASEAQMRQLAGMKGLIAKPSGEIMEVPVISNFKEGLGVLEYFNAAHGARKGNVDTALKTANAGYLTRRLVDVAQDCIITEEDCGTEKGVTYNSKFDGNRLIQHVADLVKGRVLVNDVINQEGNVIITKDTIITPEVIDLIKQNNIHSLAVRSPVTCDTIFGCCTKCYGVDLSTNHLISVGEAVGVIAAQSIGEPGVQLTLNTFHIGGSATKNVAKPYIESEFAGKIQLSNVRYVVNKAGEKIITSHSGVVFIVNNNKIIGKYNLEYSAKLLLKDGDSVSIGTKIAEWDAYNTYIIAEHEGSIVFNDLIRGVSYSEISDENADSKTNKIVLNYADSTKVLQPYISLVDKGGNAIKDHQNDIQIRYILNANMSILFNEDDKLSVGDKIVKIPRDGSTAVKDITGGLPRIEELFEARNVSNPAIITPFDGYIKFTKDSKLKTKFSIHSYDTDEVVNYVINKDRYVKVYDGARVNKGDIIVDGMLDPHDILQFQGVEALTTYITTEVQAVYKLQGIDIDSKHIEIIVKYMLNRAVIKSSGDTDLEEGYHYSIPTIKTANQKAIQDGKEPAIFNYMLYGITKSSMQTDSFISAASFQETLKVLTDAAVAGKRDLLMGVKESVILGRLVPVGTGYVIRQMRKKSDSIDNG
jgi:DNA-directed RNA polymerase subunit beta'